MKLLSTARIAYAGYSNDFSRPGDRRRFSAYARQRGLSYEYPVPGRDYDIVVVTQNADLTGWIARKRRDPSAIHLILDLVDSYFQQTRWDDRVFKGIGRYVERRDSVLSIDFRSTLKQICTVADGVLCSTPEQREEIGRYNARVALSFDWLDDELGSPKSSYTRQDRLRLVWEGQAGTLQSMRILRETLNRLRDRVELHVVTDPSTPRWYGRFGIRTPSEILAEIACPITYSIWKKSDFDRHIVASDVAIIPMDMSHPMIRAKPDNKLVLLWKLGMPVVTSATAAYRRAMADAGLAMTCETAEDWYVMLSDLADAPPPSLERLGTRGRDYALRAYDAEHFRRPFDTILTELGYAVGA